MQTDARPGVPAGSAWTRATPGLGPAQLLRGEIAEQQPVDGVDYSGVPVRGLVWRLRGTDWLMTVTMDRAEIDAPAWRSVAWIAGLTASLLLALATGAGALSRGRALRRAESAQAEKERQLQALHQAQQALRDSEAHHRSVIEVLREGVLVLSPEGRVLSGNPAAQAMLGGPDGGDAALRQWQLLDGEGRPLPPEQSPRTQLFGERRPMNGLDLQARRGDGPPRWFSVSAQPVFDDQGLLRHVVVSFSDITEQRQLLRQVEDQARQLQQRVDERTAELQAAGHFVRQVADNIPGRVVYWDAALHCRFANRIYCDWHGRTPEQIIGLPMDEVVRPEDLDSATRLARGALSGQAQRLERLTRDPQGRPMWFLVQYLPDRRDDGQVQGVFTMAFDVTALKEAEAEGLLQRDRAEAANRAKSAFLANMSHEIRTPMNAIIGLAHLVRRDTRDALQRDRMDKIGHAAQHLLQIINDILDLSKVEAGRLEVERVPCAVHEIVNEVADIMRLRAEEKGVSLAVEFPQALPAAVRTDPARVRQIVTNLIGNALKFTRDGLVSVSIGVHRPPDGAAQLVIDVADTGIGIAPDKLDAIFEPFVQAEASTTRQFGGTGLGLAISRRFARALGGDITVTSVPERGSTFHVTLDAGALEGVAWLAPDALAAAHGRVADAPERSTWRFPARRVLVVDDGVENRELVRVVLEGAGLQVVEAHDGAMALAQVEATRPDLVLMDVQMPVMDGYTATRRLREQGCCLPVLALTANAMKGFETEIAAAGFTGYLTKPVDIDGLLAELARHLGGQRVAEPAESSPEFAAPAPVATAAATPAGAPIVSRLAGHARLARVVRTFGQTLPEKLHAMDEALAAGRFDELAALAHWLKGAGGTVGFDEFFEPARQFEQHARAGRLPELTAGLRELHALAARLVIPADEPVRRAATAAAAADDVTA